VTPATVHRTSRTMPAILAALAALVLLMALSSFVRAVMRHGGFPGATSLVTFLFGAAVAIGLGVVAWRAPQVQVDEAGVHERSPRGVRTLAWHEITRVAGEKRSGKGVMLLHRGSERWEVNFLAFPEPEQVVGFVTAHLPRTAKVAESAPAE
jgi:hypothetical protein